MEENKEPVDPKEAQRINQQNYRYRLHCMQHMLMLLYALIGDDSFPCTEKPMEPKKPPNRPQRPKEPVNGTPSEMNAYRRKLDEYNRKLEEHVIQRDQYDADFADYQVKNERYMEWMHEKVTSFKEKFEKICEKKFQERLNSPSSSISPNSSSSTTSSDQFKQSYDYNNTSSVSKAPVFYRCNSESSVSSVQSPLANLQIQNPQHTNNAPYTVPQSYDNSSPPFDCCSNYMSSNVTYAQSNNYSSSSNQSLYQNFNDGFFGQYDPTMANGQAYNQPIQYTDIGYQQQQPQNEFCLNQPQPINPPMQPVNMSTSLRQINNNDSQESFKRPANPKRPPISGITPMLEGTESGCSSVQVKPRKDPKASWSRD